MIDRTNSKTDMPLMIPGLLKLIAVAIRLIIANASETDGALKKIHAKSAR